MSPARRVSLARRVFATLLALTAAGAILSACGGTSSASFARTACADVQRSITLYDQSLKAKDAATAKQLGVRATTALRHAVQPAALAGSQDGSFEALELTLSESNRVPERYLIPALTSECAANPVGS